MVTSFFLQIEKFVTCFLYYFFMRSIIPLLLILLAAWSSTCQQLGYSIVGPLSKAAYDCLGTQIKELTGKDPFVFVRIYKVSGTPGIDPYAAQALANAKASTAAFKILSYIQICRSNNYDYAEVNQLAQAFIPNTPFDSIWIKVVPNSTPGCSWDGYSQTANCAYLNGFGQALALKFSTSFPIGIFSTASIWYKFFGYSCNMFGQDGIPLWYGDYGSNGILDSTFSFDDFAPFGGWTSPSFKQVAGTETVSLCNNPNWNVIVDVVITNSA